MKCFGYTHFWPLLSLQVCHVLFHIIVHFNPRKIKELMILLQFVYSQYQQSSYWWWKIILTDRAWKLLLCGDMKTLSPLHLWQSIYTCNKSLTHQTHLNNQLQIGFRPSAWTECFRCWKGSDNPRDIVIITPAYFYTLNLQKKSESKQSSFFKSVFSKVLMKHHLVISLRSSNQRLLVVPMLWNSLRAFTLRLKNKSLLLCL